MGYLVKIERINDGSENGVLAYYCECGNCKTWDIEKGIMEKIEKLHFKRNKVLKKHAIILQQFRDKENRILGIKPLDLEKYKIKA